MPDVLWFPKDRLRSAVLSRVTPASSVLDIGCGISPQDLVRPEHHFCCDPHGEYVERLQQMVLSQRSSRHIVMKLDWRGVVEVFPERSIDTVVAIDVIEHLDKQEGEDLLRATQRIARRQIILFTPLGFLPQHHETTDAWGMSGAAHQEHRSGWTPEDFDSTWEILACESYHLNDNLGRPLARPFGAFWAIQNLQPAPGDRAPAAPPIGRWAGRRHAAHRYLDRLLDMLGRA
jgi:hypothetical protein